MKQSIRTKLLFWYLGSIAIIALFFWFAVHIFMIDYATEMFIGLLVILSILGFIAATSITKSLSTLTEKIKSISSRNLSQRIHVHRDNDEISELADTFNDLLNRLDASFQRERQFIGDVAHELKTPIATMKSGIEVALTKRRSGEEYKEVMHEMLVDIDTLSRTLTDVLDLAWTDAQRDRVFDKKVNLSELVEEVYEIEEKLAAEKHISINKKIDKNIMIHGEREKLARALLNILDNAIKYSNNNGEVDVLLNNADGSVQIKVVDSGIGIPHHDLHSIFDRFYRGANVRKLSGSGLGLSIAKSIVQIHKGTISVESKKPRGTTVTITLPTI
jgi:heavy metal sensor kinase